MTRRIAAALLALAALPAAAEDGGRTVLRTVLENGAVVIVKEDHNMPVVTLQAWFPVGSTTEGEHLGQGLSHFVEHMIFKGTEKQAPGDFARQVKAGGGDLNAYTHFERTVFHCVVRSEHFDPMLASFSDVIMNSKMDPEEARKEQQVIVNELRMYEDDPNRLIQYAYNETAWRVHPARHPIGGYIPLFKTLQPEDVGRYFRRWYAPNNMIFVCVGDVDGPAASAAIAKAFGGWQRKALPPVVHPVEPPQTSPRRERRTYPVKGVSSGARLKVGWPSASAYDADAPALDMLALVMGHGDSSRLAKSLKHGKKLVQSVSANSDTPTYRGSFSITAQLDPASLEAAEAAILEEVRALQEELVPEEELKRVLAAVLAWTVIGQQDVMSQADTLGQGEMYHGDPGHDRVEVERLKRVTPEDLRRVARAYLVPERMTVASVVPREGGGEAAGSGGAARAEFEPRVEEFALGNGMRVVVRRNPNAPAFAFTLAFLAGSRLEDAGKPGVANLAAEMLLRGTRTRDAARLADEIGRTGGTLKVQGGRNTLLVNAEMLIADLDRGLELAADLVMNPAFEPAELENARRFAKFQLERTLRDASGATTVRFLKALYGDHSYGRLPLGTMDSLATITPDDVRAFHERFVHPGNCVAVFVGDLDPAAVRAGLEKRFGSWKRAEGALPAVKPPADLAKSATDEVTDATKNMGVAIIGFPTVTMGEPDRWTLQVLEKILGGMGGRVWDAVREKKNLAYSVWASNVAMYERGYFQFGVMAQGQNLDAAIAALKDEIRRVCEEPVSAEELERAKNGVVGEMLIDLQKNSQQSQQLALDTVYGLGPRFLYEVPKKVDALTAEDLRAAARKYFAAERSVTAVTRPGK